MIFVLTDAEIIGALQAALRQEDGYLAITMPKDRLQEHTSRQPILSFTNEARTVHCGHSSARLSPTQYAVLKYVYENGRTGFEELQDTVWDGKQTSDGAVRANLSKINAKLMDSGFGFELIHRNGRISLEKTG